MKIDSNIDNKVKFILETDWIFQEPIDFEYKEYILLAYFKKIDDLISQNKLYPAFIELSLHLANLQTVIKENVILFTKKNFKSLDDEVLLKEILAKNPPELTEEESKEIDRIIKYSAVKFFDYFNILKSYWTLVYDTISISIKKNKKYLRSDCGYMTYINKKENKLYVWEYKIDHEDKSIDEQMTTINKIYEGSRSDVKLNYIINEFSNFSPLQKKLSPVFELKSEEDYPIEETLLPLFKRKLTSYIFQSIKLIDMKTI